MARPEEISEALWNKADEAWHSTDIRLAIACAILAAVEEERKACASTAEDHHDDDGTGPECQGCGEIIAERIRQRKGSLT